MQVNGSTFRGDYRWLLVVEIGGTPYRLADSAVSVPSSVLGNMQFEPGIVSVDLSLDASGEAGDTDALSIPMRLRMPVSLAVLWHMGVPIHMASATLYVLPDGGSWSDVVEVLSGSLDIEQLALAGQVIRATLTTADADEDRGTILDPYQVINPASIPLVPMFDTDVIGSSIGQFYPLVFGRPGLGTLPGSPAYMVGKIGGTVYWLVSSGRTGVSSVDVIDSDNNTGTVSLTEQTDAFANPYMRYASVSPNPGNAAEERDGLFVTWGSAGAVPDPYSGGLWTSAASHLRYMAEASTRPYDIGSIKAVENVIGRYALDGYWDAQGSPSAFIEDELLPILPLTMTPGPGGAFFVLVGKPPLSHECVDHLIDGHNCHMIGQPELSRRRADLVDRVEVRFGASPVNDEYAYSITMQPEPGLHSNSGAAAIVTDTYGSPIAHAAGTGGIETVESRYVWRQATAGLIASDIIAARSIPTAQFRVLVSYQQARVMPGQAVALTVSDYSLSRHPSRVVQWTPTVTGIELVLEVMLVPLR